MRRPGAIALALVLVLAATIGTWWLTRSPEPAAPPAPQSDAPSQPVPSTASPSPGPCAAGARHPFDPRTIRVAGLHRSWSVIAPPRDGAGVPGVPPLTAAGKQVFAWDREQGVRPGDERGNVLLNAHTWPDGSALGNRLLASLHRGDRLAVSGRHRVLCYRVTHRVEVLAERGFPAYYARNGRPQLAIIVCSGRRLGPGRWLNRTIWFASPTVRPQA